MTSTRSFEVAIWGINTYDGKRGRTYTVRWRVSGVRFRETFPNLKLAESFRATLLTARRNAEAFDRRTGRPAGDGEEPEEITWLEHAMDFMEMKWPHVSARHRKSIVEGLVTATVAALPTGPLDADLVRQTLTHWAFNAGARKGKDRTQEAPQMWADSMTWALKRSPTLSALAPPAKLRPVLDALGRTLDGTEASASTIRRKRSAVNGVFEYAVELERLPANPMARVSWRVPATTEVVDRGVVVNVQQARALMSAVRDTYPSLEAFMGCIFYAGLRPAEVRRLTLDNLEIPSDAQDWGTLRLQGSTQTAGAAWTDSGKATEDRALKHRARQATREVPMPPELASLLKSHIERFPPGVGGRLFVNRAGRGGRPVAKPYSAPQSMGIVYRVWDKARSQALTEQEYTSPLARRPYDLRHAAVSLWLNAGVPPTQAAAWAGHGVDVLLRVYAKCIVGQDESSRRRLHAALTEQDPE